MTVIVYIKNIKNNNLKSPNKMSKGGNFDWYKLSKLNEKQPNIQSFSQIIHNAHFGQQISRVPLSLRQKLLTIFQKSSYNIKKQYFAQKQSIEQLKITKKAVNGNIAVLKQQLEVSRQKINSQKIVIEQKKKFLDKLKDKVKKKQNQKQKATEVYFCPFCTREDFKSRNQFSFHMVKEHAKNISQGSNNSQTGGSQQTIPAQVKDLILSLKDKQIQLMSMMLEKKKQMQTMQLQQMYQHQIRKIKTQANFLQRKSNFPTQIGRNIKSEQFYAEDDQEELKGQSQYLFYEPQRKNRGIFRQQLQAERKVHQHQIGQGYSAYLQNMNPQQQPYKYPSQMAEQAKIYQPKTDYYNVFGDNVALSDVERSLSPQKINEFNFSSNQPAPYQIKKISEVQVPKNPQKLQQIQIPNPPDTQTIPLQNNLNFSTPAISYNHPIYKQTNNKANTLSLQSNPYKKQLFNQSLSNSQNQIRRHQSIYIQPQTLNKSKSIISDGHIFNSGPLLDDDGDGSDYEDYFGHRSKNKNNKVNDQDQIADEQIRVNPRNYFTNYSQSQKSLKQIIPPPASQQQLIKPPTTTIQNSNLKYSQQNISHNQSNIALQYSKDKSFLDISRSHSKSKQSSDMIQLSNSFSKRALDYSKNNDDTINLSDLKLSKLERQRQNMKKYNKILQLNQLEYHKKISFSPMYANQEDSYSYQSNPKILQQFKMQEIYPQYQRRVVQKTQKSLIKPVVNQPKFKIPQNIQLMKTNPGILQQFLFKQQ